MNYFWRGSVIILNGTCCFNILNILFWNYYLPLRDYTREPPFIYFESTSLDRLLPWTLDHNCHLSIFVGQDNIPIWKAHKYKECDPLTNRPTPATSPPPPHLPIIPLQGKLQARATPFCITTRLWRNVYLVFLEIISSCTHLVLPSLLPLSILVIITHQYGDSFSRDSKGNTWYSPKQVVIRRRCAEARWPEKK